MQNWPIPSPKSWLGCFRSRNDFFELRLQSLVIRDFEVAAIRVTKVHTFFERVSFVKDTVAAFLQFFKAAADEGLPSALLGQSALARKGPSM